VLAVRNEGTWRGPIDELIPVGPIGVKIRLPNGMRGRTARLLASNRTVALATANGWASFEVASIVDHEVVVIDGA
jgi:hypothetical protein